MATVPAPGALNADEPPDLSIPTSGLRAMHIHGFANVLTPAATLAAHEDRRCQGERDVSPHLSLPRRRWPIEHFRRSSLHRQDRLHVAVDRHLRSAAHGEEDGQGAALRGREVGGQALDILHRGAHGKDPRRRRRCGLSGGFRRRRHGLAALGHAVLLVCELAVPLPPFLEIHRAGREYFVPR
eukprot:12644252-Alexandrium_andersonii.AAC.1